MNQIQVIAQEYMELCKRYDYLNIGESLPMDWENTLTAEKVIDMRESITWLISVASKFTEKLDELADTLQPYDYHENTIYTIAEYITQGFTSEEASQAQRYDILWNKWVQGKATHNEIVELEAIAKELGL